MHPSTPQIISLTIIISTGLLLLFGVIIGRYIFLYQQKRYRHQQEVTELRETFTHTLLQSKIEIQEQTLDHISKELHANFSHLVSLININLSEILPGSNEQNRENILETKALAKQLLSDLKALSASLNTDHIMKIGFTKALENECHRIGKAKKYQTVFTKLGEEYRLSPEREIILLRLCQEALNNILKYAKASLINVSLTYSDSNFTVSIKDNGIGFNIEEAQQLAEEKQSTGFINMHKRAKLINAIVSISSQPGSGTCIIITMPK